MLISPTVLQSVNGGANSDTSIQWNTIAVRSNQLWINEAVWVSLSCIVPSERSQTERLGTISFYLQDILKKSKIIGMEYFSVLRLERALTKKEPVGALVGVTDCSGSWLWWWEQESVFVNSPSNCFRIACKGVISLYVNHFQRTFHAI